MQVWWLCCTCCLLCFATLLCLPCLLCSLCLLRLISSLVLVFTSSLVVFSLCSSSSLLLFAVLLISLFFAAFRCLRGSFFGLAGPLFGLLEASRGLFWGSGVHLGPPGALADTPWRHLGPRRRPKGRQPNDRQRFLADFGSLWGPFWRPGWLFFDTFYRHRSLVCPWRPNSAFEGHFLLKKGSRSD